MREILTISLGELGNFTAAHFWNIQDEKLKSDPNRNPVLYFETHRTMQYVPRSIFVDFRNKFGNYMSVFSSQSSQKKHDIDMIK